jgi:hypothetical protein
MSNEKPEKLGLVADGIYRMKGGMLFERPWIDGVLFTCWSAEVSGPLTRRLPQNWAI